MTPWSTFIARELAKRGLTEAELARRSGVPKAHFTKWKVIREDGSRALRPTVEQVRKIAHALDISVLRALVIAELITAEEARQRPEPEPDVTQLSNEDLAREVSRRLRGEDKATDNPDKSGRMSLDRLHPVSPSAVFSDPDDCPVTGS